MHCHFNLFAEPVLIVSKIICKQKNLTKGTNGNEGSARIRIGGKDVDQTSESILNARMKLCCLDSLVWILQDRT